MPQTIVDTAGGTAIGRKISVRHNPTAGSRWESTTARA